MQLLGKEHKVIEKLLIIAAVAHVAVAVGIGIERRKWWTEDAVMDGVAIKPLDALDAITHIHVPAIAGLVLSDVWRHLTLDLLELFHCGLLHDFNH